MAECRVIPGLELYQVDEDGNVFERETGKKVHADKRAGAQLVVALKNYPDDEVLEFFPVLSLIERAFTSAENTEDDG